MDAGPTAPHAGAASNPISRCSLEIAKPCSCYIPAECLIYISKIPTISGNILYVGLRNKLQVSAHFTLSGARISRNAGPGFHGRSGLPFNSPVLSVETL
jgi:hypothetical protein